MTRLLALSLLALASGCARIEANTRVERGPLLRTYERPVLLEGGLTADVRAEWPLLKLTVVGYDVCRAEKVEEYAEDHITERTSSAVGPALSTGIANVLASGVLLATSFLVSAAADTNVIDGGGRYGPSTRQYLQGSSLITLGVGLPSLVVGLVTKLGTGDEVVTTRAEQVVGQKEARCNERPANGPLALVSAQGARLGFTVADGALDVDGTKLTLVPEELRFADREIELTDEARATFSSWAACVALEQDQARGLEALSETGLLARAERLRECRKTRGEAMAVLVAAADAELARRRESGSPAAWAPGTNVASFEEAVSAYAPALRLTATSRDLAVLDAPEAATGRAVLLEGVVGDALTENIGVIQIGDRQVFLFIPPKHAWTGTFPNGTRVEAVALLSGRQTVGERTLPLLRAVWMRAGW